MNEHKIIELYTIEKMTLRMIAEEIGASHHRIKNKNNKYLFYIGV